MKLPPRLTEEQIKKKIEKMDRYLGMVNGIMCGLGYDLKAGHSQRVLNEAQKHVLKAIRLLIEI